MNGLSGYVHTQGDVSGMADSVTRLLRDQTNAKFMGEWGKAYVQKFYDERSLQEKWLGLLVKSIH